MSDDLLYRYVLDNHTLGDNDYTTFVQGWGDAIKSQSIQYFHSNGRAPIHVLVQMFSGVWGQTAYAIFVGALMLTIIWLFTRFTIPPDMRRNPLLWLAVALTYLYLFQSNSGTWYSIAGGMNYLFPMLLILLFLLTLRHLHGNPKIHPAVATLAGLLGFATGWSQECYSLPLSGGLFILMLFNLRKVKGITWLMAVTLWIGTAVLVFAPGNFVRLEGRPGVLSSIINGVRLLTGTYLFWIMLAGFIILRFSSRARFISFIAANRLEILILGIALAFGMVANTLPQSFNGISFFSAIILFRMSATVPNLQKSNSLATAFVTIILVAISVHQSRIIAVSRELRDINHRFVENYLSSPDGVMAVPATGIPADVRPFAYNWFTSPTLWWLVITLEKYYTHDHKPLRILQHTDYSAYTHSPEQLKTDIDLPEINGIYHGEEYLWFGNADAPACGDTISLDITPRPITGPAKWLRFNTHSQPATVNMIADSTNIIKGQVGLTGIKVGKLQIKQINIHKRTPK